MPTPRFIVVTGRPGSGKTTLAHALAQQVRCPAICRDEIKEGLVNTTGHKGEPVPGDEIARLTYETFFDTVKLLLDRGVTLVAEAAFQHKLWAPKLEPIVSAGLARVRIIVCSIDPQLARQRHIDRGVADPQRENSHQDRWLRSAWERGDASVDEYDPPRLHDVPTLTVDTSDAYLPALDAIIKFALGE